jgi:nitrous oxide reductase
LRAVEIAIVALVMTFLAAGGVLAFVANPPSSPCAGVTGAKRSFTIVADLNGYNGSKYQTGPWPVATVHQCDQVAITLVNNDTQAHGFAITYYSNAGLEIVGGQQPQTLNFQATKRGQFTMYCSLGVCTVHKFMTAGLLNVT